MWKAIGTTLTCARSWLRSIGRSKRRFGIGYRMRMGTEQEFRSQESEVRMKTAPIVAGRARISGVVLTFIVMMAALPVSAREEVKRDFQKTVPLPAGRGLKIDSSLTNINVRAQAKNEATVIGVIHCSADRADDARAFCNQIQIRVEESSTGATVRVENPRNQNLRNLGWSINLDITMPESAPLEVRNRFGGVSVQGAHGGAFINNTNGNIYVAQARGKQRIENQFGNVEVQSSDGDVSINNGNGWVRVSDVTGAEEIGNRFGDVRVTNSGKSLIVRANNGKVEAEHVGGLANITTSFG